MWWSVDGVAIVKGDHQRDAVGVPGELECLAVDSAVVVGADEDEVG